MYRAGSLAPPIDCSVVMGTSLNLVGETDICTTLGEPASYGSLTRLGVGSLVISGSRGVGTWVPRD
jgi:hypothetical protein